MHDNQVVTNEIIAHRFLHVSLTREVGAIERGFSRAENDLPIFLFTENRPWLSKIYVPEISYIVLYASKIFTFFVPIG